VGDAPGDGDGAAPIAPVDATTRKAKRKRKPREFMARKFQTYAYASTANTLYVYYTEPADCADKAACRCTHLSFRAKSRNL
jgi:hypothetical protein